MAASQAIPDISYHETTWDYTELVNLTYSPEPVPVVAGVTPIPAPISTSAPPPPPLNTIVSATMKRKTNIKALDLVPATELVPFSCSSSSVSPTSRHSNNGRSLSSSPCLPTGSTAVDTGRSKKRSSQSGPLFESSTLSKNSKSPRKELDSVPFLAPEMALAEPPCVGFETQLALLPSFTEDQDLDEENTRSFIEEHVRSNLSAATFLNEEHDALIREALAQLVGSSQKHVDCYKISHRMQK